MTRTYLSDQREEDELLNPEEVRKTLKVGDKTLYRYRRGNVLHPVVLNSRTYRYRKSEISRLIQDADSRTACQKSQQQAEIRSQIGTAPASPFVVKTQKEGD